MRAVNTAAESENKIHDDGIAAAYGFRGGLVPGVTVYGYMAAAVLEHFGTAWLERGAMDVRFRQPVYHGEEVLVRVRPEGRQRVRVEIADCASGLAWLHGDMPPPADGYPERPLDQRPPASCHTLAPGSILGTLRQRLDLAESRMSAPLAAAIGPHRVAHPAILLALANEILLRNVTLGPWIHTASEVRKFGVARDGEELRVRGKIEDCFERKGHHFVVLDVVIVRDEKWVIERTRHTAIWRPRRVDPRE